MRDINFFKAYLPEPKKVSITVVVITLSLIVLLFGGVAFHMYTNTTLIELQGENMGLTGEVALLMAREEVQLTNTYKSMLGLQERYTELLNAVRSKLEEQRIVTDKFLLTFTTLQGLHIDVKSVQVNIDDATITLNGVATTKEAVTAYQQRLIGSGLLENIFIRNMVWTDPALKEEDYVEGMLSVYLYDREIGDYTIKDFYTTYLAEGYISFTITAEPKPIGWSDSGLVKEEAKTGE